MTVVPVASGRHRAVRVRPRRFVKVRNLMSLKIPPAVNRVWDAAERHPRLFLAAAFLAVAGVWAVRSEVGAMALTGVAAFILGRGAGLVRAVALKDKLTTAELERDLYKADAYAVAIERDGLRAELVALTSASTRTVRMPTVPDGEDR